MPSSIQSVTMKTNSKPMTTTPEGGLLKIRMKSVSSLSVSPMKKKPFNKTVINVSEIRKKCEMDFQRSWESTEIIGGFSCQPRAVQLMNDEPIRFRRKDIDHEDFNEKYKHFELYERIRQASKKEQAEDAKNHPL